ncbi:hypothetical protein CIG19_17255 [Enterobacterales bacterium CwR94]|nr:hypothetical protein CIG19_17255 [Enterobacterales bacterium CwR94]
MISKKRKVCFLLFSLSFLMPPAIANEYIIIDNKSLEIDGESDPDARYRLINYGRLIGKGSVSGSIEVGAGGTYATLLTESDEKGKRSVINGDVTSYERGIVQLRDTDITGSVYIPGGNFLRSFDKSTIAGSVIVKDALLGLYSSSVSSVLMQDSQLFFDRSTVGVDGDAEFAIKMQGGRAFIFSADIQGDTSFILESSLVKTSPVEIQTFGSQVVPAGGTAFSVRAGAPLHPGEFNLVLDDNTRVYAETLLESQANTQVNLKLVRSHATGDIQADESSEVNVNLHNGSTLRGAMRNVASLSLDDTSALTLTGDSNIGAFALNGGTVSFAPTTSGDFHTLTLDTLSGGGRFSMNTDAAGMRSDFLEVSGHAEGHYLLHVANTGAEPGQTEESLILARTGGGSAEFSLDGGAVDIGAWQYNLVRRGNEWGLEQSNTDEDDDVYPLPRPVRRTAASTDAVIALASVPKEMFYAELMTLRSGEARLASGLWGTFLHHRHDVQGPLHAAWHLRQNGLMIGSDVVRETDAGALVTGAFMSQSSGKVHHARGGTSSVEAWGAGVYALLQSAEGSYLSGVVKINRFDSQLSAQMTDGVGVSGRWQSLGYGAGLESGIPTRLGQGVTLTPYAGLTAYQNQSHQIPLSNGMIADTGNGRSLQIKAGTRLAAQLTARSVQVAPYIDASVSQELARSRSVQINRTYHFDSDYRGSVGKVSAGADVQLSPRTSVWAETNYGRGEHSTFPLSGNLGVRVNF